MGVPFLRFRIWFNLAGKYTPRFLGGPPESGIWIYVSGCGIQDSVDRLSTPSTKRELSARDFLHLIQQIYSGSVQHVACPFPRHPASPHSSLRRANCAIISFCGTSVQLCRVSLSAI